MQTLSVNSLPTSKYFIQNAVALSDESVAKLESPKRVKVKIKGKTNDGSHKHDISTVNFPAKMAKNSEFPVMAKVEPPSTIAFGNTGLIAAPIISSIKSTPPALSNQFLLSETLLCNGVTLSTGVQETGTDCSGTIRAIHSSNTLNRIAGTLIRVPAIITRHTPTNIFNVGHNLSQGEVVMTGGNTLINAGSTNNNSIATNPSQLIIKSCTENNTSQKLKDVITTTTTSTSSQKPTTLLSDGVASQLRRTSNTNKITNNIISLTGKKKPAKTSATTTTASLKITDSLKNGEITGPQVNGNNASSLKILSSTTKLSKLSPTTSIASSTSTTSMPLSSPSSSSAPSPSSSSPSSSALSSYSSIYECIDCDERFDSKLHFDIHRSGHLNNMKCAICNMVLKSLKNYEKHCLRCKPYECQICGRVVRFRPNFIKHMRVHSGQQSERHKYKCEVCQKEFMSFEYFKVHKKIHNENVNLTCEICGKIFSALASLRGHLKLHSGVKLHKCDICGKGFGQRYNLKIHSRSHTGDFPYECKMCKKKFHTRSSMQTHMQAHDRKLNTLKNTTQQSQQQYLPLNSVGSTKGTVTSKIKASSEKVLANEEIEVITAKFGGKVVIGTNNSNSSRALETTIPQLQFTKNKKEQQQKQQPMELISSKSTTSSSLLSKAIGKISSDILSVNPSSSNNLTHTIMNSRILSLETPFTDDDDVLSSIKETNLQNEKTLNMVIDWHNSAIEGGVKIKKEIVGSETDENEINDDVYDLKEKDILMDVEHHINRACDDLNKFEINIEEDVDIDGVMVNRSSGNLPFDPASIKSETNLYPFSDNSNDILTMGRDSSMYDLSPRSPPSSQICISDFDRELDLHVGMDNSWPPYGYLLDHVSISNCMPLPFYADNDDDDFKSINNSLMGCNNRSSGTTNLSTPWDNLSTVWNNDDSTSYTIHDGKPEEYDIFCDTGNLMYT